MNRVILALNKQTIAIDKQTLLSTLETKLFKHVLGRYKHDNGETIQENSYIVELKETRVNAIIKLAKQNNQESILYIDNKDNSFLVYCETGKRIALGKYTRVTEEQAKQAEAYTLDDNQYSICI